MAVEARGRGRIIQLRLVQILAFPPIGTRLLSSLLNSPLGGGRDASAWGSPPTTSLDSAAPSTRRGSPSGAQQNSQKRSWHWTRTQQIKMLIREGGGRIRRHSLVCRYGFF